jgi:hypothetical protein
MSKASHKHTASVVQNYKAHLASAYNELGKELASTKVKVVGNYTLGKVIGEGTFSLLLLPKSSHPPQGRMGKCAWVHIDSPPLALLSNKFPKPFLLPSLEKFIIIASFITPILLSCMRLLPPKIPYGWSQNYVREANYSTTLRKRAGYQKRSLATYSARYVWQ